MEEKKTGRIEQILDKLIKSRKDETLNEINNEDNVVVVDETVPTEEVATETVETSEELSKSEENDFEEEKEEEKEETSDDEIEKSVEDEMTEDEVSDEVSEDEEESIELSYEELMDTVMARVEEVVGERLSAIETAIESLTNIAEKQTDAISGAYEDTAANESNLNKSIKALELKLDKVSKMRKSVKNVQTIEKFEKEVDIDTLSKSQKATILADALEAGNVNVTPNDVIGAELGGYISEAAKEVILKSVR